MHLGDIKKLTEAKYAGKKSFFIKAWDPEDGDIELCAGPFPTKQSAEKAVKQIKSYVENLHKTIGGDKALREEYLPNFFVEELYEYEDFMHQVERHIKSMAF